MSFPCSDNEYLSVIDSFDSDASIILAVHKPKLSDHSESSTSKEDIDFLSIYDIKMFSIDPSTSQIQEQISSLKTCFSNLTPDDFRLSRLPRSQLSQLQYQYLSITQPIMVNLKHYHPSNVRMGNFSRKEPLFLHQRKSYGNENPIPARDSLSEEEEFSRFSPEAILKK